MKAKKGDRVKVEYEGRLENGEIFDSSSHGDHSHPLEFIIGSGNVIKGFDDAIRGMKLNEEREVKISPEEAYGEINEEAVRDFPIDMFKGAEIKEGMTIGLSTPEGHQFPAKVIKVDKEKVKLDLNHPLAGKKLIFKLKLVEIN
jgi:FKBP-type peptidyl-prolyl cis-trans isomerase 2